MFLSLPLCILVILASSTGLFSKGFYAAETLNWETQSLAQDWTNLFIITPCLIVSSVFSYRQYENAERIWAAVNLYLAYTYTIYAFDLHFNKLFPVYCLCLGLSCYSFFYFLFFQIKNIRIKRTRKTSVNNVTAWYMLLVSVAFCILWLSEIIPSILQGKIPGTLVETGLFTNAVQVMDLAVVLPGIFITGLFMAKGNQFAILFAPVVLSFFVLMDITIAVIVIAMKLRNINSEMTVALAMGFLAIISVLLLVKQLENNKTTTI